MFQRLKHRQAASHHSIIHISRHERIVQRRLREGSDGLIEERSSQVGVACTACKGDRLRILLREERDRIRSSGDLAAPTEDFQSEERTAFEQGEELDGDRAVAGRTEEGWEGVRFEERSGVRGGVGEGEEIGGESGDGSGGGGAVVAIVVAAMAREEVEERTRS